jgi:hypothetical protein
MFPDLKNLCFETNEERKKNASKDIRKNLVTALHIFALSNGVKGTFLYPREKGGAFQ